MLPSQSPSVHPVLSRGCRGAASITVSISCRFPAIVKSLSAWEQSSIVLFLQVLCVPYCDHRWQEKHFALARVLQSPNLVRISFPLVKSYLYLYLGLRARLADRTEVKNAALKWGLENLMSASFILPLYCLTHPLHHVRIISLSCLIWTTHSRHYFLITYSHHQLLTTAPLLGRLIHPCKQWLNGVIVSSHSI